MALLKRPGPKSEGRRGSRIDAEAARHIWLSPFRAVFGGAPRGLGGAGGPGSTQARALHDDLMGAVGEAIERAVGEDRIVEEGHPLVHRAIARDHGGGVLISLDEDIVEVAGLLGGELAQPEIVELCGAPHNSTNGKRSVMWSRALLLQESSSLSQS